MRRRGRGEGHRPDGDGFTRPRSAPAAGEQCTPAAGDDHKPPIRNATPLPAAAVAPRLGRLRWKSTVEKEQWTKKRTKQRRPTRRERRGGRPRSRRPLHADSGGGDEKCAARANRIESWRNDVPLRAAPRLTDVTHGDAGVGLDSGAAIVSAAPIDRPNQSELRYSSKPNCPAVRRGRRALRTQPTPRTSASSSSWRR